MSKFRTSILIFGILIVVVAASLLTVLALYLTGTLKTDPIEIVLTVTDEEKTYDGTPLTAKEYALTSGELLEGHRLSVEFTGSQTDAGESESGLSVKVLDVKGFDVSDEYAVKTECGKLSVTPVKLTVSLNDREVVYNGREVEFSDWDILEGKLVAGHKIAGAAADAKLLNAGDTLPDDMKILVYDPSGNPVTSNYDINFRLGVVKVVKRPITIKPVGASKIYDGEEIVCKDYEITEGSLAVGQTAVATVVTADTGMQAKLIDADSVRVRIDEYSFAVLDDNGDDVTENYAVEFGTDFLTVKKRGLTVTAKSGSWTYDGKEHSFETDRTVYLAEGLAAGEEISRVYYSGSVKDVGRDFNTITGVEFSAGKRSNYEIVYINGTLEVTPMSVTVYSKSFFKEYDGKNFGEYLQDKQIYETSPALPDGFTLESEHGLENKVNAESGTYILKNVEVNDADGVLCTGNFVISVVSGQYAITKKPVSVQLNRDLVKTYTSQEQTITNEEAFAQAVLPDGITSADFEIVNLNSYINADRYSYSAKLAQTQNAGNYDLTVDAGLLIIERANAAAAINVDMTVKRTYNGTLYSLKPSEIDLNIDGLEDAEVSSVDCETVMITGALMQRITVKKVNIVLYGKDITDNVNVVFDEDNTEIELVKRSVLISVSSCSVQDEGQIYMILTSVVGVSTATPLVSGDKLVISDDAVSAGGGLIMVELSKLKIINSAGEDVTYLYEWANAEDYAYGSYTVVPATV